MQFKISVRPTHQVIIIICYRMKKSIIKKYKNMKKLDQNPYINT